MQSTEASRPRILSTVRRFDRIRAAAARRRHRDNAQEIISEDGGGLGERRDITHLPTALPTDKDAIPSRAAPTPT